MARSLYDVLGVPRWAPPTEVKRSFRRLAKRFHPDLNPDSGDQFLEIQAAYQVLSNPLLRREYDEGLEAPREFRWDPPPAYDGPSHKVKMPRGYVDVAHPFPKATPSEAWMRQVAERRRRLARRVWLGYVVTALAIVATMFGFAAVLASEGLGFQAAVTASGGGMMLGLLVIAWVAKGIGAPMM